MPRSSKSRFNSIFSRTLFIFLRIYAQNAHVLSSPTAIPSNACAGKKGKGFANRPSPHLPHIAAVKGSQRPQTAAFFAAESPPSNAPPSRNDRTPRRRTHQEALASPFFSQCPKPFFLLNAAPLLHKKAARHASKRNPPQSPAIHRDLPFPFLRRGLFFSLPPSCFDQ